MQSLISNAIIWLIDILIRLIRRINRLIVGINRLINWLGVCPGPQGRLRGRVGMGARGWRGGRGGAAAPGAGRGPSN